MNTATALRREPAKGIPFEILRAYGIGDDIIEIWKNSYGDCLLPIQEKAIVKHNVLGGKNLVIFAPTSSGKTLVGEIVSVHYAMAKKRALYLVPMKALAEEKYHHFKDMYGPIGVKTIISTHDRKEFDRDLERKDFDIGVVVFEKLNSLLVSNPSLLQDIGLIVIDELQMLGDETRGAALELLLTKILLTPYKPQLLGLSAVLGEGEDLAKWLRAELLVETNRPVELRKGVLSRGVFSYVEHNSGVESEEKWPLGELREEDSPVLYAAKYLAENKNEQSIIFLPDKPATERLGSKLKEIVELPAAVGAIEDLQSLEDSYSKDLLSSFLEKGIAIHNADLSSEERYLVEKYFRAGEIRILLSTSTLAMGINLPAKNVFIPEKKWNSPRQGSQLAMTDISKAEHENMGGRAGRLGFVDEFGRAILVTSSPFHKKTLYDFYIRGGFEKLKAALVEGDIDLYCLDLVASGLCSHEETAKNFLLSTYTGVSCWAKIGLREHIVSRVRETIAKCLTWGLLKRGVQEQLQATEKGKITAQMGISVDTCLNLIKWMDLCDPLRVSDLEVLVAAALSDDAKAIHVSLTKGEFRQSKYRSLFGRQVANLGETDKILFKSILGRSHRLQYEQERALKKAMVLYHWISPAATKEIEGAHHLFYGAIKKMGEEFSWLVEAIANLAKAEGWPEQVIGKMNLLSQRISFGVDSKGLELAKLRIPGLGRGYIAKLVKDGFDSAQALAEANPESLVRLLPQEIVKRIATKFGKTAGPVVPKAEPINKVIPETKPESIQKKITDAILVVDRAHPGTIEYQGKQVTLTSKQFWLLATLADSAGKCVSYDAIYNKVWGENVAVEMQQISYHKTQLLKKLGRVAPKVQVKTLITPIAGEGMVLNLRAEEIRTQPV